ncbi:hypothetical protein FRC07_000400 [Ceratobasidium sp. 392]|nr:hypothetical protein FRC07_000400 [Ceratobasidium sp. 392]
MVAPTTSCFSHTSRGLEDMVLALFDEWKSLSDRNRKACDLAIVERAEVDLPAMPAFLLQIELRSDIRSMDGVDIFESRLVQWIGPEWSYYWDDGSTAEPAVRFEARSVPGYLISALGSYIRRSFRLPDSLRFLGYVDSLRSLVITLSSSALFLPRVARRMELQWHIQIKS